MLDLFLLAAIGDIATVAGTGFAGFDGDGGPATAARLKFPSFVLEDSQGNMFIADGSNDRVRRVDAGTGTITTVAGTGTGGFSSDTGPATSANLTNPSGLAIDGGGNLFIADYDNDRIRRVAPGADGQVDGDPDDIITTVAGTGAFAYTGDGGPAVDTNLKAPRGVWAATSGLLIADTAGHTIRKIEGEAPPLPKPCQASPSRACWRWPRCF